MLTASTLSFDFDDPPSVPPVECVDVVLWQLACELFHEHKPQPCSACKRTEFCEGRWLAQQGLATACGEDRLLSDYWRGLARQRWAEMVPPRVRRGEVDPAWWVSSVQFGGEPLVEILARRDVTKIFAFLRSQGVSQYALAVATGLTTAAVGKVRNGTREIHSYDVLVRIAEGLHIPREAMGLAHGRPSTSVVPSRSGEVR